MTDYQYSTEELLNMDPQELISWLADEFMVEIPVTIEDPESLKQTGILLSKCSGYYSYLSNMAMLAKLRKRQLKRAGKAKPIVEDALSREEIFSNFTEIMKTTYSTISRMITVRQMELAELRMNDSR